MIGRDLLDRIRLIAAEAYNEAEGDLPRARRLVRVKSKAMGFGLAEILLALSYAWKLYMWLKQHNYLSRCSIVRYPDEPDFLSLEDQVDVLDEEDDQ